MPNYEYRCQECQTETIEFIRYELRDELLDCEACGELAVMKRYFGTMPGTTKASYIDGHKRPGWSDMLTEAKLKEAAASKKWSSSDVREINKELDNREKKQAKKKS
jgi:putative FmdB family regulatory protein